MVESDLIKCALGPRAKDLSGRQFGRLIVVGHVGKNVHGNHCWACDCQCGTKCIVSSTHLLSARTVSCGCYARDANSTRMTQHGMSKSSEHRIWRLMIDRCTNSNCPQYRDYGGRGISVCERWQVFEHFYADMGPRPSATHSIDRHPNNNGHYEPGNCRWATQSEQMRNTRSAHILTHNGASMTVVEWAERLGVPRLVLDNRIKYGWTVERMLTQKPRKSQQKR